MQPSKNEVVREPAHQRRREKARVPGVGARTRWVAGGGDGDTSLMVAGTRRGMPQGGTEAIGAGWAGRKLLCGGGGGVTRKPIFPTPPLLGRRDGRGGSGRGCPTCRAGGGGGVNPTSMAQNDTHVALIILTTQMWGGGDYWWKKLFRAKFCVPAPSAPTSVLTQNKGPDTEPHFSNPPPPPSAGVLVTPPPPLSNFQVALLCAGERHDDGTGDDGEAEGMGSGGRRKGVSMMKGCS